MDNKTRLKELIDAAPDVVLERFEFFRNSRRKQVWKHEDYANGKLSFRDCEIPVLYIGKQSIARIGSPVIGYYVFIPVLPQ